MRPCLPAKQRVTSYRRRLKDCGGPVVGGQHFPSLPAFGHPYPYAGTPERVANSALGMQRLTAGPVNMIEQDLAKVVARV